MLKGDLINKEFFQVVCKKPEMATIASLKNSMGEEIWNRRGLQQLCQDFYVSLYIATPDTEEGRMARQAILQHVPVSFIEDMG